MLTTVQCISTCSYVCSMYYVCIYVFIASVSSYMPCVFRLPRISTQTGHSLRLAVLESSTSTSSTPPRIVHTHTLRSAPIGVSATPSKAPATAFMGLQGMAAWSRILSGCSDFSILVLLLRATIECFLLLFVNQSII